METVNQVKEALSARSRTATLEELASQGRKQVRVIKAQHVAAMISAAVHTAIEESGLIPKNEADSLVERSREEFRSLMKQREQEVRRLADLEERLRIREAENESLRAELQEARDQPEGRGPAAPHATGTGTAAAAGSAAPGAEAGAEAAPATPVSPDLTKALDKLAGSLNERLEKLGQKMGISSAVEGEEVNLDGLFKDSDKSLESNMENIQVKKKAGGGIAANLERLKKLKGGG